MRATPACSARLQRSTCGLRVGHRRASLAASPRRRPQPAGAEGGAAEQPAPRAERSSPRNPAHAAPDHDGAGAAPRSKAFTLLVSAALSAQLLLSPLSAAAAPPAQQQAAAGAATEHAAALQAPSADEQSAEGTEAQAPALRAAGTVRSGEFLELIQSGQAFGVLLAPDSSQAAALLRDGRVIAADIGGSVAADELLRECQQHGVEVMVAGSKAEFELNVPQSVSPALKLAKQLGFSIAPALLIGAIVILSLRLLRGSQLRMDSLTDFMRLRGGAAAGATKSPVRFADVAGVEGAKLELQEVVDFLKNTDKYSRLGAKIPKGVLLTGPPGTGKTLLAKAVAGEAGVPFFSCAASEFVEIFVGVGASRVRDLFDKAKKAAPCIIFIDELDAVGRQRGVGIGGGSDEREQTINQLLSEMDGFEGNAGVIVLSATNRPDVLDTALLRPGRFDRRINVDLPDVDGRLAILRIYAKNKPLGPDVDLRRLAQRTPGFSGADLANLMNEAAITAARRGKHTITSDETADALDKIAMGPEKASAPTTPEKKRLVAYHEAGHAIVGALLPDYDRVEKVSIIPRASSQGATLFTPSEERLAAGFFSRAYLLSQLSVALGGRAAEEIVFGAEAVTTGAADDLRAVARTARSMVEVAGLSRRFTHAALRPQAGPAMLGGGGAPDTNISIATADEADAEVQAMVQEAYARALQLLRDNEAALHRIAAVLIERESVDGAEVERLLVAEGARTCPSLRVAAEEDGKSVSAPTPAPLFSSRDGARSNGS